MGEKTKIQWTDATWNPLRGCSEVSPGCAHCYAAAVAARFSGPGRPYEGLAYRDAAGKAHWTGKLREVPEKLGEPLRWSRPRMVFVNSMSDLFHEDVADEFIDRVFAVMALCPQHVFQVLTKRADRMAAYASHPDTPFRVAKAADAMVVAEVMGATPERIEPLAGFPGYFVSNHGFILTGSGLDSCRQCGSPLPKRPRVAYCGKKCKDLYHYHKKQGHEPAHKPKATLSRLSPIVGEQGHQRVMVYRDGEPERVLVHRAVLTAFERPPVGDEQGCHRDGNPGNNHIANLRWGTQEDNWDDRRRHGNGRSYAKLSDGQVRDIRHLAGLGLPEYSAQRLAAAYGVSDRQILNIVSGCQWSNDSGLQWPLPNCWKGVSVEDQRRADGRIPDLLACPAAIRWVSYEPALGPVDFGPWLGGDPRLDWIVCGGESGPKARPFDFHWARSVIERCRAAGVACFLKQLGSNPVGDVSPLQLRDHKGGDPDEWPGVLRVREFPVPTKEAIDAQA